MGFSRKTCVLPGTNATAMSVEGSVSGDAPFPVVKRGTRLVQNRSATGGLVTFELYDQAIMGCIVQSQMDEREPPR